MTRDEVIAQLVDIALNLDQLSSRLDMLADALDETESEEQAPVSGAW